MKTSNRSVRLIKPHPSAAKKVRFQRTVLPNGLVVLSERQLGGHGVSIGVFVKLGSRFEEKRVNGISHFLEHMLFKGTLSRSAIEIVREIEETGGEFNAFTDREYTCFHLVVLKSEIGKAVEVLTDIILNSTFDREEFERERKVILQEISMLDDSPEDLAYDRYFELIYPKDPLGRNILGTPGTIKRMKRSDLLKYYKTFYQPKQMIISGSGDLTHQTLVKHFRKTLRKKTFHQTRLVRKTGFDYLADSPKVQSGRWWLESDTEQAHVIWGVPSFQTNSKDRFAIGLLNYYLGGGMSSLLFQEIREKNGLAYNVYSYVYPFIDTGIFTIYVGTKPSQVNRALQLVEKCISQLCDESMSKEVLESTKNSLKGSILLSADDVESRMLSVGRNEIFLGRYLGPEAICRLIDDVTVKDIRRVARKLFVGSEKRPQERSVLVLGPKPKAKARASFLKSR